MNNNILLSICIPTYNRLNHIKRQIEALKQENLYGCEVIISCNPSSEKDESALYLKNISYDWLKVNINEKNIGGMENMRKCVSLAKGEYIWLLGDDDYIRKNIINHIILILTKCKPSMYHMNYYNYDQNNKTIIPKRLIKMKSKDKYRFSDYTKKLGYDFAGSLFISANIFLREIALVSIPKKYDDMISAYRLILSMKKGNCYFDNNINVLSGVEISWKDKQNYILFNEIPCFLEHEGFKTAKKIYLGLYLIGYLKRNKLKFPRELNCNKLSLLPYIVNGILRKIIFSFSRKEKIDINDFYV